MGAKNKKLITNRKLSLGIGGILLIAGMLFLFLTKQALISGILAGIGFAILVFYLCNIGGLHGENNQRSP